MNATNVLKLNQWVIANKFDIKANRRSQTQITQDAAKVIGCKVSINALREVLQANGIETRPKSKSIRRIEALEEENKQLRGLLAKAAALPKLPDWLAREFMAIQNLDADVRDALRSKVIEKPVLASTT